MCIQVFDVQRKSALCRNKINVLHFIYQSFYFVYSSSQVKVRKRLLHTEAVTGYYILKRDRQF